MSKDIVDKAIDVANNETVQNKLVEMLDALQHGAVKVGETVVKYTPDAIDTALWVVRLDGIQALLSIVFFLLLGIGLIVTTYKLKAWVLRIDEDIESPAILLPIATAGFAISLLVINISRLFNVWLWISIYEPKLWLAKQLVAQVLK